MLKAYNLAFSYELLLNWVSNKLIKFQKSTVEKMNSIAVPVLAALFFGRLAGKWKTLSIH